MLKLTADADRACQQTLSSPSSVQHGAQSTWQNHVVFTMWINRQPLLVDTTTINPCRPAHMDWDR